MNKLKQALGGFLAGSLLLLSSACTATVKPPVEEPVPETPAVDENIIPGADEPGLPETKPLEQAGLVDSDLMLHRLGDNLLNPVSVAVRLSQSDNSTLTQFTPAILEEIAGFICQNYTVLRSPAQVSLGGAIQIEVYGEKDNHVVYIQQWIDGEGKEHSFVQVEEDGIMGQYIYDPITYDALEEVLKGWQFENHVALDGKYKRLTSADYQYDLRSKHYNLKYFLQFNDKLLLGLDSNSSEHNYMVVINSVSGRVMQSIEVNKPILDVRRSNLEGYDFYIITKDSIHIRSINDSELKLDFSIPQNIRDDMLHESEYPLFDLDNAKDELVYISNEGLVFSNQLGTKNKVLLKHEDLYELLEINKENDEAVHENLIAMYIAPKIMNDGRIAVCPILVRGEEDKWAGFSLANLSNGTVQHYIDDFSRITNFEYPDDNSLIVYGERSIFKMNTITREIKSLDWSCNVYEEPFLRGSESILLWRHSMDYGHELLIKPLSVDESTEANEDAPAFLTIQGDRIQIYGSTEDFVLFGWSDIDGDFMAVAKFPAES